MEFLAVTTGLILIGGVIYCIMNCLLDEKSKLFHKLEKLF